MCDDHPPATDLDRRQLLGAVPLVAALPLLARGRRSVRRPATALVEPVPGLAITPRSEWGGQLVPRGPLPVEPEVRVLLVHHSVNVNTYAPDQVAGLLGGIYRFHTGEKGWPDIAYNFFVDRFGGVWEGRTGSLDGPVAGSATGGNQGSSQLCCFLGDHTAEPPTAAAQAAMGRLLGWLASRSGVDVAPGATATFTSRGSNRWPAGSTVRVPTVAGHRDVSQTECPGDAAYRLVADGTFARTASSVAPAPAPPTTAAATTAAPTTAAPTTAAPSTAPAAVEPPITPPPATGPSTTGPARRGTARRSPTGAAGTREVAASGDGGPEPAVRTAMEVAVGASVAAATVFGVQAVRRHTEASRAGDPGTDGPT